MPAPPSTYIAARFNTNLHPNGSAPRLGVVHSMECPLQPGRAVSWANYLATSGYHYYAPHYFDPSNSVRVGPDHLVYQHVGNGNVYDGAWSVGYEQSGYAAYTRDQWMTDLGRAQIGRLAAQARYDAETYGIPKVWLGVADLKAGRSGFTSHNNCSLALGGSDHTDPGGNWPVDYFVQLINGGSPPPPPPEEETMVPYGSITNPEGHREYFYLDPNSGDVEHSWYSVTGGKQSGIVPLNPDQVGKLSSFQVSVVDDTVVLTGLNFFGNEEWIIFRKEGGSWLNWTKMTDWLKFTSSQ